MSVASLYESGRVHPLKPLSSIHTLPGRDQFEASGRSIFDAVQSLLAENLERGEPALREAMRRELAQGRGLGFTRFDVVCPTEDPTAFSLLEVQAGDPSAIGWHDALCEALGETPSLMATHRRVFEALTPKRRIAFVVLRGSIVESDHRLLAEHYSRHGWTASVVEPGQLEMRDGALLAAGEPVDAVFRDALDELLADRGHALIDAPVVLMNPFIASVADDKSLLEALSTPGRWSGETARVLAAHVPCTRLVRDRRCDWEGTQVDLRHLLEHDRRLVLKPIDGYGGIDVTVGPSVSPEEWSAAVKRALSRPDRFVVQRHVPLPRENVTLVDGTVVSALLVHSLWFCPGLSGAFLRASQHPVVNVHQGGGLAPVFFRPPFR